MNSFEQKTDRRMIFAQCKHVSSTNIADAAGEINEKALQTHLLTRLQFSFFRCKSNPNFINLTKEFILENNGKWKSNSMYILTFIHSDVKSIE